MRMFRGIVVGWLVAVAGCGNVKNQPADGPPADTVADAQDAPAQMFSEFAPVTVGHVGVHNPAVTNDGLNIYFMDIDSANPNTITIFTASRASTSAAFGTAAAVPVVNVVESNRYVEISGDGLELYFTAGDFAPIMISSRVNLGAQFSTPVAVGSGIAGNWPSISADKRSLYFIAKVGSTGELRVATRTAVGQPFGSPTMIPVNGALDIYAGLDISKDELAIVRSPSLIGAGPSPVVISRRASKSDPFGAGEELPMVGKGTFFNSARFAADDTEVWIGQAVDNNPEAAFVSRLQ